MNFSPLFTRPEYVGVNERGLSISISLCRCRSCPIDENDRFGLGRDVKRYREVRGIERER